MDIQKQGRYCRYHEAPQRRRATLLRRMEAWAGIGLSREREGRKRILPGYDNTNLGAGWHRTEPGASP